MKNDHQIEIYADGQARYRWRHKAGNGEIISDSGQGYVSPAGLIHGLEISHPGFKVEVDEDYTTLVGSVVDGVWPETHAPRLKVVRIPVVLFTEKVRWFLRMDGEERAIEELQAKGDFAPLASQASVDLDDAINRSMVEAEEDEEYASAEN